MLAAIRRHWPEYLMEGALLGIFMVVACAFCVLLFDAGSPAVARLPDPVARRALMGLTMGITAVCLISSPWGQQSGAHMNPAVTLTFFRLGKIEGWDVAFYVLAQCAGGFVGALAASAALSPLSVDGQTRFALTLPGDGGPWIAFAAEALISFLLMSVILRVSNSSRLARLTPYFAGALVAAYITLEAPISGMSMNPARTLGSALSANVFTALWVYFLAPPMGMMAAALVYERGHGLHAVLCAKLHHENHRRCIFRCGYAACGSGSEGGGAGAP